ncbi:MAG: hypothetical protein K2X47_18105, partial [Bdellovibrionales bacterium]|nr:hypothetical protein [Bdellovibrionales bacterium]
YQSPAHLQVRLAWENLKKSNKVGAREMVDRKDFMTYPCRDQCACIANFLSESLRNNPRFKSVLLHIQPGLRAPSDPIDLLPVKFIGPTGRLQEYSYHKALVVIEDSKFVGIVDPLVFGTARNAAVSERLSRTHRPEILRFFLGPIAPKSGTVTR